jgi:hypothetical protein
MYERWFKDQMNPWTLDDLKLTCEDCGKHSEEVDTYAGKYEGEENQDLCGRCYEKRTAKEGDEPGKAENAGSDSTEGDPLEKIDLSKLAPEAVAVIRRLQETRKQLLGTKEAGQPGSS